MIDWVDTELTLLRQVWPNLEYNPEGHWVLIERHPLPAGWSLSEVDVAFQIPPAHGQPPYAFHVRATGLTYGGQPPGNWTTPSTGVSFPGDWSIFSWAPETWAVTDDPTTGSHMLSFARSFNDRFKEGA